MLNDLVQGYEYRYEVYLCKPFVSSTPNHQIISCLSNCIQINSYSKQLQNVSELNFTINKYWNDVGNTVNTIFDLVNTGQIILLQTYIGDTLSTQEYLYIYETDLTGVTNEVKSVKCYSKHYQWNKIKIRGFQDSDILDTNRMIYTGTTFDAATPSAGGILDYIIQEKLYNTWTVSYVSASIANKYRAFDISESSILDVIKTVEQLFNCIVFFDTYNHSLSVKSYDDLPTSSGLILSGENYLKGLKQEIKTDQIVTRLYVEGKGGVGIQGVNITGQNYIDDFTYFKTTNYMSASLISAFSAYDAVVASATPTYVAYQASLSAKQIELANLQQDYSNLNIELKTLQDSDDVAISRGTFEGHNHAYWMPLVTAKENELTAKNNEITAKLAEIASVQSDISAIATTVSYEANFTTAQLQEILQFINEETVKCDTEDEAELLSFAQQVLALKSVPPIEFSLDIIDIYNCVTENYSWDKFVLGATIDLEYPNFSIQEKPRITAYTHNPSNNSLSITVSNKPYFNDDLNYISSLIALTRKSTTLLTNERDNYKSYSVDKNNILTNSSTIDAETNPVETSTNMALQRRGLWTKKITDVNENDQMRILEDKIIFTQDNWLHYSNALTASGLMASNLWVLTNTDGSMYVSDNDVILTNLDLTLNCDSTPNSIYINPREGIKITNSATPVFYADANGNLWLKNIYINNGDSSITLSPSQLTINDGKILIKNRNGTQTIIDEYGIDPNFLDYFKNMIWNSSFEVFDSVTKIPTYWTGGESTADSSFHGTYSLKLTAGQFTVQTNAAGVNPNWYDNLVTRVSFYSKLGSIKAEVWDDTNQNYFTLVDNTSATPSTGQSITFDRNSNWQDSRNSFYFDPQEAGHSGCAKMLVKLSNVHASETAYVDAIQLTPDFSGKWSQIYKDGQYSISANNIPDFTNSVNTIIADYNLIYVQPDEPATPVNKDCWIDTDDYSRYDLSNKTSSGSLLMSDEEFVVATTSGITLTLEAPTQNGVYKVIKNASSGSITVSGTIDNLTSKILYPYESLSLISGNNVWYII